MEDEPIKNPMQPESPLPSRFEPLAQQYWIDFSQVGGLDDLKRHARMKIIEPFKHPALFKKFKKQAGGGILIYGPPGCGKTWFARAIAGECQATFFNVGISDILDMYMGNSEKNIKSLFEAARSRRPAVIFIDEIDALGRKRELLRHSGLTNTINSFLAEMDGVASDNDEILVLGATNAPWDVDSAFRRPGRFDRTLFVPPPDAPARAAIFRLLLQEMPIADIDYELLAERSEGHSGADIRGVVDIASEQVLEQIMASGEEEKLTTSLLTQTLAYTRPSINEWLDNARSVVEYANSSGIYDELAGFLHKSQQGKKRCFGF